MNRPWAAERTVSLDEAAGLIDAQFPELAPARVELVGVGWDNTVVRVNRDWTFRFPRRAIAAPLLEAEARVLPRLAPLLPLAIPVPRFVGRPSHDYPWPFVGHAWLGGRSASDVASDRARVAEPLARFLRALHDVPVAEARAWGAGPDALARLDTTTREPRLRTRLADLVAGGAISDASRWDSIIDDAASLAGEHALVHGDLYGRHVLVDEVGAPCGVIDWGDVHVGHPAVDLAVAPAMLPPSSHDVFRRAYGLIPDEWWRAARFKALFTAVAILHSGRDQGDAPLAAEGARTLEWLVP